MDSMIKIALASKRYIDNDIVYNFNIIKESVESLEGKVNMVCFGEAFLHGFDALTWEYNVDKKKALSLDSKVIIDIKKIAAKHKIAIAFGFFELLSDSIYCSYVVIDESGSILDIYRRKSIGWKEYNKTDNHYKEGSEFHTFRYREKSFVTSLCGDLWYEENIDELNDLNADIVLWPLHLDYELDSWFSGERDCYIDQSGKIRSNLLMINNISATSHGGCYYFYDGKVVESLEMGNDGFLVITI